MLEQYPYFTSKDDTAKKMRLNDSLTKPRCVSQMRVDLNQQFKSKLKKAMGDSGCGSEEPRILGPAVRRHLKGAKHHEGWLPADNLVGGPLVQQADMLCRRQTSVLPSMLLGMLVC